MPSRFGSLANPVDVQYALDIIADGRFIGVQYHGVFIMIFSGTNLHARQQVLAAKNEEDASKPLSSLGLTKQLFPFIDHDRIEQPVVKRLLEDNNRFRRSLGAVCHVRLPLKKESADSTIPSQMMSLKDGTPTVQMLDPYGNLLFANLVHELHAAGVSYVAASSLNLQGESEICDLADAQEFCEQREVPFLLHDPLFVSSEVRGSFPVIDLADNAALRGGHIPIQLIETIIGLELDKTNMQPAKHPHAQYLEELCEQPQLSAAMLREHILNHFYGK